MKGCNDQLCMYKRATHSRQRVIRIQSALCKVACEQNSHGLKIAVVKICRVVFNEKENRSLKKYNEQVVIVV